MGMKQEVSAKLAGKAKLKVKTVGRFTTCCHGKFNVKRQEVMRFFSDYPLIMKVSYILNSFLHPNDKSKNYHLFVMKENLFSWESGA